MTIYEKPRSEVFASNAPESEVSDFTAWLRGLGIAFDETNGLPEMSGLNNVFNLLNQYIKYLEQNGFAEWSSDLEYPVGAGVRVGAVWYRAKTRNTNKAPSTSQNDWEVFLNANALQYENPIYIENNIVKARGATQELSGVVQFANATEITNKANINKVLNPANIAQMFLGSNSINDYIELPNGLIFQWLTGGSDSTGRLITTNQKPFKVGPIGGIANEGNPSGWGTSTVSVWAFSLGESTKEKSVARVRSITSGGISPASGIFGRILVWGY